MKLFLYHAKLEKNMSLFDVLLIVFLDKVKLVFLDKVKFKEWLCISKVSTLGFSDMYILF